MVEREKGLTRREFLFKGIALSLGLAGCRAKKITLYPPEATPLPPTPTPLPPEITPPKETIPYREPEQPEILSLAEVSQLYHLEIENLSSYWIGVINRAPLEEAMEEIKVDPNQRLRIVFKNDELIETTGRPAIMTLFYIDQLKEDDVEESFSGVGITVTTSKRELATEEKLSHDATVAFRIHLASIPYLLPYIKDGELSEFEYQMFKRKFERVMAKIGLKIDEEVENDRSKLIFIFAPLVTA